MSPKKPKNKKRPITAVDSFVGTAIRNVIFEIYPYKSHVTCKSFKDILKSRDIFHGSISSLVKILQNIVFSWKQDETWIIQKGSARRSWQDKDVRSVKRKTASYGKRYMILHAGTEDGWVPKASLIFP